MNLRVALGLVALIALAACKPTVQTEISLTDIERAAKGEQIEVPVRLGIPQVSDQTCERDLATVGEALKKVMRIDSAGECIITDLADSTLWFDTAMSVSAYEGSFPIPNLPVRIEVLGPFESPGGDGATDYHLLFSLERSLDEIIEVVTESWPQDEKFDEPTDFQLRLKNNGTATIGFSGATVLVDGQPHLNANPMVSPIEPGASVLITFSDVGRIGVTQYQFLEVGKVTTPLGG